MSVSRWWRSYEFYVDPGDGLPKRAKTLTDKARKRAKEQRRQRLALEQRDISRVNLAPGLDLRQLNGIWFTVNYTVTPDGNELIKQKRQLSSKELRRRHLVNQSCGGNTVTIDNTSPSKTIQSSV